ncbi:site-specific DNA-methyltransferase [Marinifilum caeruleilacunae]|uniref:site-specific DNA-methyltransferase (adenine-specific) n=1 Tax=Marinifilum caeruleilacunae TaxID=2499076 RepID=A0ABX1WT59_9BACT|nr:site-specific DNA-methyltransferase [Marinifilum caeruleilacunae]NOU59293.1 site-specific DNA-methyltransferase [Marinifilum caeruleilacunae]
MTSKASLLNSYKKQKHLRGLREFLPQVFDGELLDIQKLKAFLGEESYIDQSNFELSWFDKNLAINKAKEECNGQLVFVKEKSALSDQSENLFIEGDNLDALKLLKKDYQEKIKLIYIDPPYNTGKNFGYSDNYQLASDDYLEYLNHSTIGRVDQLKQHRIESGELHTQWLNLIFPRLILSKDLLSEDGVVLLSIDESEKANAQLLCNEVFGEENFVGSFVWENRSISNDSANLFSTVHEYILVYARNKSQLKFKGEEKDFSNYSNPDYDANGDWTPDNPTAASGNEKSRFPIINPFTGEEYLPPNGRFWAFSESRVEEWSKSGKMVFPKELGKRFLLKKYRNELRSERKAISSVITDIPTLKGTKELKDLYPDEIPFKHPKPTELLIKLFDQLTGNEDFIMDIFAGSASTAHAVYKMNKLEASQRKFICIQNKEILSQNTAGYRAGFNTIADVAIDRIERAGKQQTSNNSGVNYFRISYSK